MELSLADVAPADIAKFKKSRIDTGIKTATYIKDHNLLHAIFEAIQRDWGITLPKGNPVKRISKPKQLILRAPCLKLMIVQHPIAKNGF